MKEKTFYVICAPYFATGGTELLHQLAHSLKIRGINVFMYYPYRKQVENNGPIAERFKKYEIDFVDEIKDDENSIIIIPESFTEFYHGIKHAKKIIWWLSVDNYYNFINSCKNRYLKNKVKLFLNHVIKVRKFNGEKLVGRKYKITQYDDALHLAQSKYAYEFLKSNNKEKVMYLSDYLNDEFFEDTGKVYRKEDIILYNPAKGIEITKKIISQCNEFKFIPIENMSPKEVKNILLRSKVYIDFGNHPGKDRFPREAAICGCCIITGKDGSAKYYEDICIDEQYKFEANESEINNIKEKIGDCIVNYKLRIKDFDYYRESIKKEHLRFEQEVDQLLMYLKSN